MMYAQVGLGRRILILFFSVSSTTFLVNGYGAPAKSEQNGTVTSTKFELIPAAKSGLDFVHPIDIKHPYKFLYIGGYASAGIAIGDINGDELQDIFLSGGPVKNRLYIQIRAKDGRPSMRFRDATSQARVDGGDAWGAGVAMVDIDNDGDLDIYVCNYDSPNLLYLNQTQPGGQPRFKESAKAFGLDLVDASFMPAFCDYDLDGDLDVFIAAHQYVDPNGRPTNPPVVEQGGKFYMKKEYRKYYAIVLGANGKPIFTNVGREDYLLESNLSQSNGKQIRFTDVSRKAGIQGMGVGNSALWWDYNQDGWPDLYIGNDFKVADQLYRNNGNGTFTDVVRGTLPHTTWFSMGSDAGDINNDGMIDLLVSDMAGTSHYRSKVTMGEMSTNAQFLKTAEPRQFMRNALFVNTGTPKFLEAAYMAGIANSDWTWATKLVDLDNDGWLDVYFTNGAARVFNHSDRRFTADDKSGKTQWDLWEDTEPRLEENLAFRNLGNLSFQNTAIEWGLKKKGMSYAAAHGDLDNDGDLDLVVVNLDEPLTLYENLTPSSNYLRIRLVGKASNRYGIGATVRIESNGQVQHRQVNPMTGFLSCNEPIVHFGLGKSRHVDKITIEWPIGIVQIIKDQKANQLLTIEEAVDQRRSRPRRGPTYFRPSRTFPALRHVEREFDDYARQPLLPYKHSQLGPGIAMADVDRDGDMDFYISRAKGTPRAVYDNHGQARLRAKSTAAFRADSQFEDMGVLFFDADRDGDRDLYAVSGSVEAEADSHLLADRLYVNDGKGMFAKPESGALPDTRDSGSVVCAADFDRDGDLDLFIGGRVVPGQYPVTPKSRLLENRSQNQKPIFRDVTAEAAQQLLETGLVSSAIWSDANGDGWIDLLVTHEWGPVKYYRNEAGESDRRILVDRTKEAGLSGRLGWWNGIAGGDLDNDGDIDYVVTNFGLNTKYHASVEKPELLYYGDFDGTGKPHLVEAKFEDQKCFPRRGLSCSSHAMPFVREKVKTFHNFGLSTLQDIYTKKSLDKSLRLAANCLETGVLVNQGPTKQGMAQFEFQPLPVLAQISPAFGVVIGDFDADGWADCFLAQNFFSPQHETGRMDSGLSLMLRGKPTSTDGRVLLEPVWPKESGVAISADAKAVSLVDFNEDGWSDLLVTVNHGVIEAYEGVPHRKNRLMRVRLLGPDGNPDCIGARMTLRFKESSIPAQMTEVYAGGGYLSQSTHVISFGCGQNQPKEMQIRWPNGKTTTHPIRAGKFDVTVRQP